MPRVLIVDDEASNLEIGEALIAQEGYTVLTASDGEAAWQMVQDSKPDLVMMDIVMPKMSGLEACRKIKTHPLTYSIPVVIVTALNTAEEKIKALKAGADDFISKPFDRHEMAARLKSLLRLKAVHDRLETSLASIKEMQRVREELLQRAAKDVETPMRAILECLQAVDAERDKLSPESAQKLESALFCVDMVTTMTQDFANIMKMENDKLRKAYESLKAQEQAPPPA